MYNFKRIGMNEIEAIKELFTSVFTIEPWNDDWSNKEQLDLYLSDLVGQSNSLAYGLFEDEKLIGVSMGHIRHWYSGTEYYIDELCIQTDKQGNETEKNGYEESTLLSRNRSRQPFSQRRSLHRGNRLLQPPHRAR